MAPASLKDHHTAPRRFNEVGTVFDICFVLNVNSRGWILEKICRIIEEASGKICCYLFSERTDKLSAPLPNARNYVFAHFALCYFTMLNHPEVLSANCHVWYTHPDLKKGMTGRDLADIANLCTHVFTPCSQNKDALTGWGADPAKISVPLGGADPAQFTPKARTGRGAVGFVGAWYERKQPEKMLQIARLMPDHRIILLGPRAEDVENPGILWHNWDGLTEFTTLPNVTYIEAGYPEFARWYQEFDVYCSTSLLEGGPIPAIEAMMSNVMPVISDTGFARDIVKHGQTGYVFDPSAAPEDIVEMIRTALADTTTDVAAAAAGYSWQAFGTEIWRKIRGEVAVGEQIDLSLNENAVRYLMRGFHVPEQRGVWTRACEAEIALPLAPGAAPCAFRFYAWIPAELAAETITTRFSVNSVAAPDLQISSIPREYRIAIRPEMLTGQDALNIHISCDRIFIPEDRPEISKETRRLGLKLGWMALE